MKAWKWTLIALSGGLLLQTSCTSDLAYYALDAFITYLPDILDALLANVTETV